jgi:hypothetical protein
MLFVLIMKETEWFSQPARLFNLHSLPANWKNLLDKQATDVLSEIGSLQSLGSNFDFPKNSKNWHFPDNLYTWKFSKRDIVQIISSFTIKKRASCLASAAHCTAQNSSCTVNVHIYTVHSVVFLKLLKRYKQSNTTHQLFVKHTKTATCFDFIS